MVARVNIVSFQGINIKPVDVQVQISNGLHAFTIVGSIRPILIAMILLCFFSSYSHADQIYKVGQMTCDNENNKALVRFNVVYSLREFPRVNFPENLQEYNYLNDKAVVEECQFKDGRRISLSSGTGQAFAYGQCGGDPSAYFSLYIDDKPIYYKHEWNRGRCNYNLNPYALLINDQKIISCHGFKKQKQMTLLDYQLEETDCVDVSERLSSSKHIEENRHYKRDKFLKSYQPVNLDEKICGFFQTPNPSNISWMPIINHKLGYIYVSKFDIDNDEKVEFVYKFSATNNYMDGSYIIYFNSIIDKHWRKTDREKFLECLLSNKSCPKEQIELQSVDRFIESASQYWKDAVVISAKSPPEDMRAEYRVRYTHITPYDIDGKIYLNFIPSNKSVHPQSIISVLNEENSLDVMCTYKDENL